MNKTGRKKGAQQRPSDLLEDCVFVFKTFI